MTKLKKRKDVVESIFMIIIIQLFIYQILINFYKIDSLINLV